MARFPIMPLFTDALVGDTMHLSAEQFGAYALILIATWRNDGQALADDDKRMAQIARVSLARWRTRIKPVLREFFDLRDGHWHQKRLECEWQKAIEKSAKQRTRRRGKGQKTLPFDSTAVEPRIDRSVTSDLVEPRCDYPRETSSPTKDSPPGSNSESVAASAAVDKKQHEEGTGARCARLERPANLVDLSLYEIERAAAEHGGKVRWPGCKGPELKARIRYWWLDNLGVYVHERCSGFQRQFWEARAVLDDPTKPGQLAAQQFVDTLDRRMRKEGWKRPRWAPSKWTSVGGRT